MIKYFLYIVMSTYAYNSAVRMYGGHVWCYTLLNGSEFRIIINHPADRLVGEGMPFLVDKKILQESISF